MRHHYRKEIRHTFFTAETAFGSLGLLATHPPLDQRIRRLDAAWDGTYTYTRLSEESTTAVIAEALEKGKQTSIPEEEEWNISAHSGRDRPVRNPDHWVSEAFGNAARRISEARRSTAPRFDHRKRAPKVRLPSGPGAEPSQKGASPLPPVPPAERIHSFVPVRAEARTILVALAERAGGGPGAAHRALSEALSALPALGEASPSPDGSPESVSDASVEEALASLSKLSPGALRRFLEVCAFAVDREGATTVEAAALLRSCSRRLGVELPEPFGS